MNNSEDIWVRQEPMSGYTPYPFTSDPAWLTAVSPLHQIPAYRDPKYSHPNYVYVRVRNRGSGVLLNASDKKALVAFLKTLSDVPPVVAAGR